MTFCFGFAVCLYFVLLKGILLFLSAMSNRSRWWTKRYHRQDTVNEPKDLALIPQTSIESESEKIIVERDDNKMKDTIRMKLAVFNDDEKMINDILREKSERES